MWTRVLVSLAVSARIPTRSWLLASRVRSWGRSAPVWALRSCFLSLSSHCFSFGWLSVDFTSLMPLHSHLFLMPTIIPAPSPTFYIYQQLLQCCGNDFLNTGKKHEAGCSSWKSLTRLSRKKGTIQHKAFAAPSLFPQPDICLKLSPRHCPENRLLLWNIPEYSASWCGVISSIWEMFLLGLFSVYL